MVAATCVMGSSSEPQVDPAGVSDEELMRRVCLGGDSAAFESLVHRYEHELFGYLRRYLGSVEMAEDVYQATFLRVYLKRDCFEASRLFRPWLYVFATNQAIDAQRRQRRHRVTSIDQCIGRDQDGGSLGEMLSGTGRTAAEQMEDREASQWVRSAVEGLPELLKSTLVLVYYQGMKYRQAAGVLGISVGTVKSRLHAAIHKLDNSLQHGGGAQPQETSCRMVARMGAATALQAMVPACSVG